MAATPFEVDIGFSIEDEVHVLKGTTDPSTGGGQVAPLGSFFIKTDTAQWYKKFGAAATDWIIVTDANDISDEDGFQNGFMGKTGTGEEYPEYSSNNVVTSDSTGTAGDGDNLEEAIGALDADRGPDVVPEVRTQNPLVGTNTTTANLSALDSAIGDDADIASSNIIANTSTVQANLSALDAEIGAAVTPEVRTQNPTSDQAVNLNIDALDSAIGNDSQLVSTTYISAANSVYQNLSALDAAIMNNVHTDSATNVDPSSGLVVDSVPVATTCIAEWHLCVESNANPDRRRSYKITALNDGTISTIEFNRYARNRVGGAISGLNAASIQVNGNAGNMELEITATENINWSLTRIAG